MIDPNVSHRTRQSPYDLLTSSHLKNSGQVWRKQVVVKDRLIQGALHVKPVIAKIYNAETDDLVPQDAAS